jgi:hypothetical protein
MGRPAGPAGPPVGPRCGPAGPAHVRSRPPGKKGQSRHAAPGRRLACVQRLVWPASGAFRLEGADLRRYRLADDDLPHLPPPGDAFPAGMPRICAGMPRVSAPGRPGVSARQVTRVSLACRGVSAGIPRRFRRTAGAGGHAFPARPSPRARYRSPPPAPSRARDPFPGGRPGRESGRAPGAGGQPLTSGPARVRLTRRMTRRSRSIAVR